MSKRNWVVLLAVWVLCLLATDRAAWGQGVVVLEPPTERMIAPLPPDQPGPYLELRSHQVTVTIKNQIATTRIEQVYYNPSSSRHEGTFLFPMPVGSQIDSFAMDVNGQMTQAELLDADKARQIYQDIVRKLADPALLEYVDQGLLKARIFPIEPNSEKHIHLSYTQLLPADGGIVKYTYPMTQRRADGQPLGIIAMRIDLQTDNPLANVYCPSHQIEIKQNGNHATAGFESNQAQQTNFELYFSAQNKKNDPVNLTLLTYRDPMLVQPGGESDGFFLLLASPNHAAKNATPQPKEVIFVLDTSGSMAGEKLQQAKQALRFCLANLNKIDRFEIVRFSTDVEPLFGAVQPADGEHLQQANTFIDRLKPIGGTAIYGALDETLKQINASRRLTDRVDRPQYIIFLTDGKPTIGNTKEQDIVDMATQAAGKTRIFCFGIGTDINTHLLDKITEGTRAVSEYVLPQEDIEVKVSQFFTKIAQPIMTDPQLDVIGLAAVGSGVQISKLYPAPLPDLFAGDQLALLGRYRGHGQAVIQLHGTINGQQKTIKINAQFIVEDNTQLFIARLWATRRVGYLLDEMRLHNDNQELRDEVVQLARTYGIVTPYTAYLIVEDEQARAVPLARQNFQDIASAAPRMAEAKDNFAAMRRKVSGPGAVAGSNSNRALKSALAYTAQGDADRLGDVAGRRMLSQDTRFVRGRAFVRNGKQWIDTQVQHQPPSAPVVTIAFNSPDYFDLLHRHRHAAAWLSVGRNVQLVIDDMIYQVVD